MITDQPETIRGDQLPESADPTIPRLLVVDDEPSILHAFRKAFRSDDFDLMTAESGGEAIESFDWHRPDVVVLDVSLPDMNGLDVFKRLQSLDGKVPVIFITGHSTTDTAIEAVKLGAYEYLFKPLELDEIRDIVHRACAIGRLMKTPATMDVTNGDDPASDVLVGRCPEMNDVYKAIGRVAQQDTTVLILGESGTGKELVARAVYQHGNRSDGPFIAINCAAIPETLLESELFGHEKGSFTGADRVRIGKFEQCAGGTVFLDEIGDMTPLTQAKILRFLQDRTFERVGSNKTLTSDVRVIAATNRDLEKAVAAGSFRSDLYYRLSSFVINLPPLRDRGADLSLLVNHFVRRFSKRLNTEITEVDPDAMPALQHYAWPGNVRELQSVIEQAILRATGPVLLEEFLPEFVRPDVPAEESDLTATLRKHVDESIDQDTGNLYGRVIERVEKDLITEVLRHTHGNQAHAARILGITRVTLRTKIRSLDIDIPG